MTFRLRPLYALYVVALIAAFFAARHATWQAGLADMRDKGGKLLELHRDGLKMAIARYNYLPFILSRDSGIRALLKAPANRDLVDDANRYLGDLVDEANRYLDSTNKAARASVLYVMDSSGKTIAATNDAFKGQSYEFRPYFEDALKTSEGRFYGIGVTTRQPGYFLSHVIADGGTAIGVAVVKVDLLPLEKAWQDAQEDVALLDGSGIAFLTSVDDWRYRPLRPLGPEDHRKLAASRQYGVDLGTQSLLASASSNERRDPGDGLPTGDLVSFRSSNGYPQSPVMLHSLKLEDDWTLISTNSVTPLTERANLVAAVTALTLAFLALAGLLLRQRQQIIRAKLEAQAVLEKRVDERTRELQALNRDLAHEIEVRHSAQDRLKRTQDELIQAAKLAALGQMSAAIVHEVSQPLTALEISVASMRHLLQSGSADAVSENIDTIGNLVARMRRMAKSLKAFARKEDAARAERVDLQATIDSAIALLRPRLVAEKVMLAVENDAASTVVLMNGIRAEQVVWNLIGNAIDAVNGAEKKSIKVRLRNDGAFVLLSIADSGPGIPGHMRDRICQPFVSSKEAGEGLGLGLFTCETIIYNTGGTLSLADGEDGGTVFTAKLPLAAIEPGPAAG
jgi:two-component system, NtrC family, C4-dicarboxylate transport sensor histidine kinase DctB